MVSQWGSLSMNLNQLHKLINDALELEPPKSLLDYCDDYYSPYYNLMYLLGQQLKGEGIAVELGVETGRASTALLLGGMEVIGIDHTHHKKIDEVIETYSNFTFLEAASLPVSEIVKDKQIVLLHVDTEHTYEQPKEEFSAYRKFLVNKAIVLFDDLHAKDNAVLRFFNELPYRKVIDDRLHPICGYGVMIYEKDRKSE
jgi:hypothetical protein